MENLKLGQKFLTVNGEKVVIKHTGSKTIVIKWGRKVVSLPNERVAEILEGAQEVKSFKNAKKSSEVSENPEAKVLIEILTKQLQPLKMKFVERSIEFQRSELQRLEKFLDKDYQWFLNKFPDVSKRSGKVIGINDQGHKIFRSVSGLKKEIAYHGKEEAYRIYEGLAKKAAEQHFANSVNKLSYRLLEKGINVKNVRCRTEVTNIGVNISTFITDGNLSLEAYTIIASGPIQKPHYRYLIRKY